jgi:hypothetical protein
MARAPTEINLAASFIDNRISKNSDGDRSDSSRYWWPDQTLS